MADDRTNRDAGVEAERVVADRLAHALRRCEVGQCGERRDHERGFTDSEEESNYDEPGECVDVCCDGESKCRDGRAGHQQGEAPDRVAQASGHRTQHECSQGEDAEGEAGAGTVGSDRSRGEKRQRVDRDARSHEVAQLGDAEHGEAAGEER
jgi:hypothetical protein